MRNNKNLYLSQRMIGEEYWYVLETPTAPEFIRNSLQRTSLLIKPLEHQSTETKKNVIMLKENKWLMYLHRVMDHNVIIT